MYSFFSVLKRCGRWLALALLPLLLAACASSERLPIVGQVVAPTFNPAMYAGGEDNGFVIPAIDTRRIDRRYLRQVVRLPYDIPNEPGTIVVDPSNRFLYLVAGDGSAIRYGIGVGREGFAWSGEATVQTKQVWPKWTPPKEMVERDPKAAPYADGMPGGLDNPLGARALYLFQGKVDTLYRIHGTNEPWSIGHAVSSGCIRLLNQDIIDLYDRVPEGTRVIVLPSEQGPVAEAPPGRAFTEPL